ncbi:MAG: hypothetical protein EP329_27215 [Deltaproteobacteria bacterium]|nr:MAG: hypothetical protein EP329_27215 [Deltaproteobacteria bacterium]
MTRPLLLLLLGGLLGGCVERVATAPDADAPAPLPWPATIGDVAWLGGDWVGATGGACFIERWLPPTSGSMLGIGRHELGGPAPQVTRETMRLMGTADGLVMMVMLEGGQVTRFPVAGVGQDGFLARRDARDRAQGDGWPSVILYERRGADHLVVTLGGAPTERRFEIPFQRLPPGQDPSCLGRLSP